MIIWSRWGILVLLALGAGAGSAVGLEALSLPRAGNLADNLFGGVGLLLAGVYTCFLANLLLPVLDKPKPLTAAWQQLPQPVINEHGVRRTHESIPLTHPETGAQLHSRPRSTLFFIPVPIWPFIFGGIGAVILIVSVITLVARG